MHRIISLITTTILLFTIHIAVAEEPVDDSSSADNADSGDPRQLVSMPDRTRQYMQDDMLDNLSALNEILGHLANDNLDAAADVAETRMGKSSRGKHHGTGMGPGRFMPLEMRKIGRGMHFAATDFAQIAKQGDKKSAYAALQKVTTACVMCHYSYRTQ
jgi:hypothetical protein